MIRIALVEDDSSDRGRMLDYMKRYEIENHVTFHLSIFQDGGEIVGNYHPKYDLILMDIEMQYMDGMTAAERIRKLDPDVTLIFITNMPQFAMNGYRVNALDYILKPVEYFAFSQRLSKALARLEYRQNKYIVINRKDGVLKLNIAYIRYIEVFNHDLVFHTDHGNYPTKGSIRDVEEQLSKESFFRCNRCYLLNLNHVDSIQGNDVQVGKDRIQVSRGRRKALLDALNNFISEVGK